MGDSARVNGDAAEPRGVAAPVSAAGEGPVEVDDVDDTAVGVLHLFSHHLGGATAVPRHRLGAPPSVDGMDGFFNVAAVPPAMIKLPTLSMPDFRTPRPAPPRVCRFQPRYCCERITGICHPVRRTWSTWGPRFRIWCAPAQCQASVLHCRRALPWLCSPGRRAE